MPPFWYLPPCGELDSSKTGVVGVAGDAGDSSNDGERGAPPAPKWRRETSDVVDAATPANANASSSWGLGDKWVKGANMCVACVDQ